MVDQTSFLDLFEVNQPFARMLWGYFIEYGLYTLISVLFYSTIKSIATQVFNVFTTKKILEEISRDYAVKVAIQKAENSRLTLDADRILTLQLHNGDRLATRRHLYKISLMQEISIEDPYGELSSKSFDKQLKNVPITQLTPILSQVTKKRFDIISVSELKQQKFIYYRSLKTDSINYMVLVSIMHKGILLGYLMLLFKKPKVPMYDRKHFDNLIKLGDQIGEILS